MGAWVLLLAVALGLAVPSAVVAAPVGPEATVGAGEADAPVVTFDATGLPPLSCGSRPDVSSITVGEGTQVVVENSTGQSAWVRVGGEPVIEVADGSAALLTLAVGQYDIRMVPGCLLGGAEAAEPVTVTVSAAREPTSGGPPSPPASSPPVPPPASPSPAPSSPVSSFPAPSSPASSSPASSSVSSSPAEPAPSPALVPAGTEAATGSPAPTGTTPGARATLPRSGVIDVTALDRAGNPKGVRLLAIVATICVLGVTAAIIRSIVRLSP